MRGSSMPHSSSGYCSGLGSSVGSRSICQPSTPFTERATHKCEIPRRSSTRQSRRVEPSGSSVAPALKTLLMEYGQSFPVKRGLAGCRQNSVSYCFIVAFIEVFTTLIESISRDPALPKEKPSCSSQLVFCAVGFFQFTQFQERHQKG